ncbi:hypothetical protein GN958_ATG00465 [Phytophthora infestans]|uniref:DDE-1 domain-containing protein n=1 Tax=Phytophthora infestans TaxID=4787 RepID=A0A8S9UTT3_PHYIN|nr:hypothetical protein GN958_ATG06416 [Phytophthora infestans]KAF4150341.1 hypothetical protein GN958_ATG00465 [Phytophthora infestans]
MDFVEFASCMTPTTLRAHASTPFDLKAPNRSTVTEWIASAWDDIAASMIRNGFTKYQIGDGDDAADAEDSPDFQQEVNEAVAELEKCSLLSEVGSGGDVVDSLVDEDDDYM